MRNMLTAYITPHFLDHADLTCASYLQPHSETLFGLSVREDEHRVTSMRRHT